MERIVASNKAKKTIQEPWLADMKMYIRKLGYRKDRKGTGSNQFRTLPGPLAVEHPADPTQWGLRLEEYVRLVTGDCYYCGSPPCQIPKGVVMGESRRNGIDRMDNTRGYYLGNCVSCCTTCNREKRAQTLEEFIENTRRRYEHMKSKGLITK